MFGAGGTRLKALTQWQALLPLALLIIGAIAYSAWWAYAASIMRAQLGHLRAQGPQFGIRAEWDSLAISGFPFDLSARFERPAYGNAQFGVSWNGDQLNLATQPWSFSQFTFNTAGRQRLVLARGSDLISLEGQTRAAHLSFVVNGPGVAQIHANIQDAHATVLIGDQLVTIKVQHVASEWILGAEETTSGNSSAGLVARGTALALTGMPMPLGPLIDSFSVDAMINTKRSAPTALPAAILEEWRASGEPVHIRKFEIKSGAVEASARGEIAFDPDGFPVGELSVTIKGYDNLIRGFAEAGIIDAEQFGKAKMLGGLASAVGGGIVSLPIRFRNAHFYLGPIKAGPAPRLMF